MSRAVWFVAGAASGVYGMVKVRRALEVFTSDGIGARVAAVRTGARLFADEVASRMNEREADLLAELRADTERGRLLDSGGAAADQPIAQIASTGSPTHGHR